MPYFVIANFTVFVLLWLWFFSTDLLISDDCGWRDERLQLWRYIGVGSGDSDRRVVIVQCASSHRSLPTWSSTAGATGARGRRLSLPTVQHIACRGAIPLIRSSSQCFCATSSLRHHDGQRRRDTHSRTDASCNRHWRQQMDIDRGWPTPAMPRYVFHPRQRKTVGEETWLSANRVFQYRIDVWMDCTSVHTWVWCDSKYAWMASYTYLAVTITI